MSEEPLKINTEQQSIAARMARGRRSFPWQWATLIAAVVLIATVWALRRPGPEQGAFVEEQLTAAEAGQEADLSTPASPALTIVEDDGQSLWLSPTAGEPISLRYLPPGTQLLLYLRPAQLLAHPEGEKVLAALGPFGRRAIEHVEQLLGQALRDLAELTIAVSPRSDGGFEYTLRAELLTRATDERLAQRWPDGIHRQQGDQPFFVRDRRACYLPRSAAGRVLVSCPAEDLAELIANGEDPIRFARDMQRLLERTDDQRTATLVLPAKFLETGGLKLVGGRAEPLRAVFRDLLGEAATAVAISANWADDFFFELQSTVALDQPPHRFAAALEQRARQAPDAVENAVLVEPLHPHGRQVVGRLPEMLRTLGKYTRSGEQNGLSITRCYLPASAGHNLLMATELLLSRPGQ